MATFEDLVQSRRDWIESFLKPWCQSASRRDLLLAEMEWSDLAGRPSPEKTLWFWAWKRFPSLCSDDLQTLNETDSVTIRTIQGTEFSGYPDARLSMQGKLILISSTGEAQPSISIDDIQSVTHGPLSAF